MRALIKSFSLHLFEKNFTHAQALNILLYKLFDPIDIC